MGLPEKLRRVRHYMHRSSSINRMYCDLPCKILVKRLNGMRGKILVLKGLETLFSQEKVISRVLNNFLIMKNECDCN